MGASFPHVFDATFEPQTAWWIDGDPIPRSVSEIVTASTLTLTFRVTDQRLRDILRPLKPDEGKVDVLPRDDGGFSAVDRAGGGNTYTLDPPDARKPLRQATDWHVRRYEERVVAQTSADWEVEVEFTRGANRTDTPSINETAASDEWGITTRYGTIATARVDADVLGTGEDAVERFELTTRLTFDQSHVFEAALNRLGGGRIKSVPDAANIVLDETTDDAVTLTLDTPDTQSEVSDGTYIVTEWESERVTDAFQEVSVTVAAST